MQLVNVDQARAFPTMVHGAQRRAGLWLAQHPFVEAVRTGSSRRDEIERWVRQIFCTTRTYGEILESLTPQTPAELVVNARQDLGLIGELGEALGVSRHSMATSEPNTAARSLGTWMQQHILVSGEFSAGLVCWALVDAMSPETGDYLAEGVERHFGFSGEQIRYFTSGMKSKVEADEYAANTLSGIALDQWDSIQERTLVLSRLVVQLYDSIGDMWSSW